MFVRSVCIACLCLSIAFAWEDDILKKIVNRFTAYQAVNPQEKVYLHLDKPYYSVGETIWLKGYLFDGSTHVADTISRVLYVDLIEGSTGKVLQQKLLKPDQGAAEGDFYLADTLAEGIYQIRAYTNWMRNFDEAFFFSRELRIYQPGTQTKRVTTRETEQLDVQFLPEGGTLVEDIETRIAYKVTNQYGKGVEVTGYVLENNQDTVVAFQSEHLGMGRFQFIPKPQKTYTAYVKSKYTTKQVAFPAIQSQGHVLIVDNLTNKELVKLFVFNNTPGTDQNLYLVGQMRGQVCLVAKGSTSKKNFVANVSRNRFPGDGIVQFTLFNESGQPLAERLAFIQTNQNTLKVSMKTDKPQYKPREKVTLEVEVKDAREQPIVGDFSLAVTDAGQIQTEANAENLVSYLLMSSDLKGVIEQPAYYFDPENMNARMHLDILMATQGWRRFSWKKVMEEDPAAPQYWVEQGIAITGKVARPRGKVLDKKEVNMTLYLTKSKADPLVQLTAAEADGSFGFYNLNFQDSVHVMLQAVAGKNDRNLSITLTKKNQPLIRITQTPFNPIELGADEFSNYLNNANKSLEIDRRIQSDKARQLKEIVVKAKKEEEEPDSRKLYGHADATVKFDQMNSAGAINIFQVLQGRIAGVSITGSGMDYTVQIRGAANFSGVVEPLFVVDGMPTTKDAVASIPPQQVDYVDILKGASAAVYGSRGGGGVMAIYTKRGGNNTEPSNEAIPGQLVYRMMGYAQIRECYVPNYEHPTSMDARPDFRSTVYWNPHVRTDQNGKATLIFFNSDHTTTLRANLEGVTNEGLVGAGKMSYTVQ
ncbi:MAG: TonB-dependent receptor plug domain-containing protein [Siphonobacter sp.]